MNNIESHNFPTWADYKSLVAERLSGGAPLERGRFLFRGMGDAEWPLKTSFDRRFPRDGKHEGIHDNLLRNFKAVSAHVSELRDYLEDDAEAWALGQHYGSTSSLLDWSESPYIAAYFAFQPALMDLAATDDLREVAARDDLVAIWALNSEDDRLWKKANGNARTASSRHSHERLADKSFWLSDDGRAVEKIGIHRADTRTNKRLFNQLGWFTDQSRLDKPLDSYVRSLEPHNMCSSKHPCMGHPLLWLFTIPVRETPLAFSDLHLMNIDSARVYEDNDGLAKAALDRTVLDRLCNRGSHSR